VKAGHRLRVYNRTQSRAEPLQQEGAAIVNSPAGASACDVVVTMLANDQAVEETVFGEEGVLTGLKKGAAHISMSTITVALSERLKEAHAEAGQTYIAAPVFGRPDAAAAAKLFIVPAGEKKAIERFQPLFDAMGQRTFFLSENAPEANLVKLSGNFLIAAMIECLGETAALCASTGSIPAAFSKS
jgi:3-hydroxyisobutyrate dehydrogenase-like beta-hydroxyacid dehydrogenase